jgi:uncharacterized protein YcfL
MILKVGVITICLFLLIGCSSTQKVVQQPLPYHNKLQLREMSSVDMIVIHCT